MNLKLLKLLNFLNSFHVESNLAKCSREDVSWLIGCWNKIDFDHLLFKLLLFEVSVCLEVLGLVMKHGILGYFVGVLIIPP